MTGQPKIAIMASITGVRRHMERSRSKPSLQWDTTTLDKVLHIFTPVILLKFGLILLFVMRPLREPYKSIECYTPKEFPDMWTKYTQKLCLGQSQVHIPVAERKDTTNSTNPPGGLPPGTSTVFKPVPIENLTAGDYSDPEAIQRFSGSLLIFSAICFLPFISWKIVGNIDGLEFFKSSEFPDSNESSLMRKALLVWFAVTKVLPGIIALVLFLTVCVLKYSSVAYLDKISNRQIISTPFYCDFWVRRLGDNLHRYTVQCILSEGDEGVKRAEDILYMFSYALGPIMSALIVWSFGLLMSQIVSALHTAYTAHTCQNKATRHFHLNRFTDWELEPRDIAQLDERLGWMGLFIFLLSAKNGSDVRQHIINIYKPHFLPQTSHQHSVAMNTTQQLNEDGTITI